MIRIVKGYRLVQRACEVCFERQLCFKAAFKLSSLTITKSIPAEKIQSVWEEIPVWEKVLAKSVGRIQWRKKETWCTSLLLDFLQFCWFDILKLREEMQWWDIWISDQRGAIPSWVQTTCKVERNLKSDLFSRTPKFSLSFSSRLHPVVMMKTFQPHDSHLSSPP